MIAARLIATRPDLMLSALNGQPLTTDAGERDNATLSLVRNLAQSEPYTAIRAGRGAGAGAAPLDGRGMS